MIWPSSWPPAGFTEDTTAARQRPYWERALLHRMSLSWTSEEIIRLDHSLDDLESVTCPVLLTKGTASEGWARRAVDILGERIPNARVVELEGGHGHHIENIDR